MATKMNLKEGLTPPRGMFAKIAVQVITDIKKRTDKGTDREGKRFQPYDEKYADQKAEGFAGKGRKRPKRLKGVSLSRRTAPPDFKLRGLTMSDLSKLTESRKSVTIGWRGEFAQIVAAHEERGKYKVGGLSDDDQDNIVKLVDELMVSNWNRKTRNVTVKI